MRNYLSSVNAGEAASLFAEAWRALPAGPLQEQLRALAVETRAEELRLRTAEENPLPVGQARGVAARTAGDVLNALAREDYGAAAVASWELVELCATLCREASKSERGAVV